MPVTVNAIGTVEPLLTVQVRAQATGQLSAVHFSEGQDVEVGQLLFSLDERPFEAALEQAKAILARDTAQAQNGRSQATRYSELFQRGLVPRTDFETQTASAASLDATVAADQASVDVAALNLQYARITAPVAGRTGAVTVHPGDLIRANDTAPLVVINQIAPVYVTFSVPGNLLDRIRRYQGAKALRVDVHIPQSTTPSASGRVTFIDNAVDVQTGTIKLKGTFTNESRTLWPGLFVDVALQLAVEPHALVVPASAVQTGQSGTFLYVVQADRSVDVRPITVARSEGDESVVTGKVRVGDVVVTDGQLQLTAGAHVKERTARAE